MSLVVNTNVISLIAQRRLDINSKNLNQSMARLSSGYRINKASDDAAGLAISQNLTSQIRRMQQASRNVQDGISALQTTEGALGVMNDNLQRIRELTVQAGNDTNDVAARSAISSEIRGLLTDIDRVAGSTQMNGLNLLDGSAGTALLQIGANSNIFNSTLDIASALTDASSNGLGVVGGAPKTFANIGTVNLTSNAQSRSFLADIDSAMSAVNSQRATVGAFQNQLETATLNLMQGVDNFSASNSRLKDVDVAAESANMTQAQILTQAATMVLSQTNELPRTILNLLQQQH
jgi:flagellin